MTESIYFIRYLIVAEISAHIGAKLRSFAFSTFMELERYYLLEIRSSFSFLMVDSFLPLSRILLNFENAIVEFST